MAASLTENKILLFRKKVEKEKRSQYLTDSTGLAIYFYYGSKGVSVTYIFRSRKGNNSTRIKLGTFPAMSLAEARQQFLQLLSDQERGIPLEKPEKISFENLWNDFAIVKCNKFEARTLERYNSIYRTHFEQFKNIDIQDIDLDFVRERIINPLMAQKKLSILISICGILFRMFKYAKHRGLFSTNPLQDLPEILPQHKVRHHPSFPPDVAEQEMINLFNIFAKHTSQKVQALLHLYFYTLLRNEELRKLKIEDLNDFEYYLETKTWKEVKFRVCFSSQAQELIKWLIEHHQNEYNPYLFEGEGRAHLMISENTLNDNLKTLGYKDKLVCHGIRGIGEKWLTAQPDIKGEIAKLCIGHKSALGGKDDQTYNEGDYYDLRKIAMQKWSDYVEKCIGKNKFY